MIKVIEISEEQKQTVCKHYEKLARTIEPINVDGKLYLSVGILECPEIMASCPSLAECKRVEIGVEDEED